MPDVFFLGDAPLPGDGAAVPCLTCRRRNDEQTDQGKQRKRSNPKCIVLLELLELLECRLIDAHGEVVTAFHEDGHLDYEIDGKSHQ